LLRLRVALIVLSLGLVLLLQPAHPSPLQAQSRAQDESEPEILLHMPAKDNGTVPYVLTDMFNNTHLLFFGRPEDDPQGPIALYYTRWLDGRWGTIQDVLVNPERGMPPTVSVVEDARGELYVVWNGNQSWYSHVPVAEAYSPRAWSTPAPLLDVGLAIFSAAALDDQGSIHVAIATSDRSIYMRSISADSVLGRPVLIYDVPDDGYFPYYLSIVATKQGSLHVCWSEMAGQGGWSRGAFCSTSHDRGKAWSPADQIATGHRGIRILCLQEYSLLARIVWGGGGVGGRTIQFSQDDGTTWSAAVDLTQKTHMEGFTGQVAVMDNQGAVHVLVNPGDGHYVHSWLQDGSWTPNRQAGWQATDWISAAIAEGDTLVVAWWSPGAILAGRLKIDAPQVLPAALPTPATRPTQMPQAGVFPTAQPASTRAAQQTPVDLFAQAEGQPASAGQPLLAGVIPAILFLAVVVLLKAKRGRE
jgi:hypothetical protein